jgi:hypothetical protein
MDRLFLDANILFSAAYKIDARLLPLWKIRNVTLCSSRYALQEARSNLASEDQRNRLTELSRALHLFEAAQGPFLLEFLCRKKTCRSSSQPWKPELLTC